MRPIVMDVSWPMTVSVCRLDKTASPIQNGWTDRGCVWDVDSSGPKKPCIRWGPGYLTGRGTFRWIYLRTLSLARDYPTGQTQRYLQGGLGATMWPRASSTVATCNRSIDSSAVYAIGCARSSLSTAFSKTSQWRDQVSRRHGGVAMWRQARYASLAVPVCVQIQQHIPSLMNAERWLIAMPSQAKA